MRPADAHGTVAGRTRPGSDRGRRRRPPPARARRPDGAGAAGRRAGTCLVSGRDRGRAGSHRRLRRVVLQLRRSRGGSPLLAGARPERPFAFEHDGVLLHGRLDVLHRDGSRALVLDYKTNSLAEGTPEEIVEADYRLQRLVYALACFRAGAEEVEVVYHFLERADAVVSTTFTRADTRRARSGALGGDRQDPCRRVPADTERVHLRGLPCPRRRVRRRRGCALVRPSWLRVS